MAWRSKKYKSAIKTDIWKITVAQVHKLNFNGKGNGARICLASKGSLDPHLNNFYYKDL